MAFSIDCQPAGETVLVCLGGDLDMLVVAQLHAAIGTVLDRRPAPKLIVVDLAELTFLDCTGVGALVRSRAAAAARGVDFRVRNPRGEPALVLSVTDTLDYLSRSPLDDDCVPRV